MNKTRDYRSIRALFAAVPIASTLLMNAVMVFATPAAFAEPMAFRGAASRPQPQVHDNDFADYVERAVDRIREEILEVPTCRAYFQHLGVDLDTWLEPNEPPYVVSKRLATLSWRSTSPICGGAQSRPPFEFLVVDKDCFRGRDVCELASLLLHEMGHLARRDTRDNEPPEFFAVCRLSACVDPARFN